MVQEGKPYGLRGAVVQDGHCSKNVLKVWHPLPGQRVEGFRQTPFWKRRECRFGTFSRRLKEFLAVNALPSVQDMHLQHISSHADSPCLVSVSSADYMQGSTMKFKTQEDAIHFVSRAATSLDLSQD